MFYPHVTEAWDFPGGSAVKNPPAIQESQEMKVQSLGQEDALEEAMGTHSSIFAWRIPWTEEPGGLRSIELQRVAHNWSDLVRTHWGMGVLSNLLRVVWPMVPEPCACLTPRAPLLEEDPWQQESEARYRDWIFPRGPSTGILTVDRPPSRLHALSTVWADVPAWPEELGFGVRSWDPASAAPWRVPRAGPYPS